MSTTGPSGAGVRGIGRAVLEVDDLDAALAFYRDVLGFAVLHDEEGGGYRYLHVGPAGPRDAGLWLMPGRRAGAGDRPVVVLYVDDLAAVQRRLAAHGVPAFDVRDDAGSRSLHVRDPAGNVLVAAELRP